MVMFTLWEEKLQGPQPPLTPHCQPREGRDHSNLNLQGGLPVLTDLFQLTDPAVLANGPDTHTLWPFLYLVSLLRLVGHGIQKVDSSAVLIVPVGGEGKKS